MLRKYQIVFVDDIQDRLLTRELILLRIKQMLSNKETLLLSIYFVF
jgi:hypothetical protein